MLKITESSWILPKNAKNQHKKAEICFIIIIIKYYHKNISLYLSVRWSKSPKSYHIWYKLRLTKWLPNDLFKALWRVTIKSYCSFYSNGHYQYNHIFQNLNIIYCSETLQILNTIGKTWYKRLKSSKHMKTTANHPKKLKYA